MEETGNRPMPDEPERWVPAGPDRQRDQDEPQPRSHPGSGDAPMGEVPEGGAIGPGPAVAPGHNDE